MSNSYQYQTSPDQQTNPYAPNDYSTQPLLPLSSQPNSQESKSRWTILLLACLSTFGASFTGGFVDFSFNIIREILQFSIKDYSSAFEQIEGYASLAPFLAGILIYYFGINRTYRLFIFLLALGRIFTTTSLRNPNWTLFVIGESCFYAANLGLTVSQLYMAIKWFKGYEISLAIGAIGSLNLVADKLALFLNNYWETMDGFYGILYFGSILCIIAAICVIVMGKIDMKAQREDQREDQRSLFEDLRSMRPVVWVLLLAIICFSVGDYSSTAMYWADIMNKNENFKALYNTLSNLYIYVPGVAFALFGFLADRTGKRIGTTFIALIIFFIGNAAFILFHQSTDYFFIGLAFFLFMLGSCLFQVSAWACLGIATPLRALGLVLGSAYSLISILNWLEAYLLSYYYIAISGVCFGVTFGLIGAIILVILTWKFDKKDGGKIESHGDRNERKNTFNSVN